MPAKKKVPPKPKPAARPRRKLLNYRECRDYLEAKYGYAERDYLGHFAWDKRIIEEACARHGVDLKTYWHTPFTTMTGPMKKAYAEVEAAKDAGGQPPYRDFWHWVIKNHEIHNGCEISFSKDVLDRLNEEAQADPDKAWVRDIYKHYIDEFADKNGEVYMWVAW